MCKQSAVRDTLALDLMPDILNLQCYLNNSAFWPTFSAYNADIRSSVTLWARLLAEPNQANCAVLHTEWLTSMLLFYF